MSEVIHEVSITSSFTGERWEGHLPLPEGKPVGERLNLIFRLFNRVDEEDNTRMNEQGFSQPSLSMGDRIELDNFPWRVTGCGFEPDSRNPAEPLAPWPFDSTPGVTEVPHGDS